MPISAFQDHAKEYSIRLAKKVGPIYFLLPAHGNNVAKWQNVFTKEEMDHAKSWYLKETDER